MTYPSNAISVSKPLSWKAILLGGLVGGAFDITYAFIIYSALGSNPVRICQSVASGLLGKASYEMGLVSAAIGLFCHFFIATTWAAAYHIVSRKVSILVTQAFVCGILYGAFIYAFMNLVVLPLSALPGKVTFPIYLLSTGLGVHMLGIGLSISLINRHYSK